MWPTPSEVEGVRIVVISFGNIAKKSVMSASIATATDVEFGQTKATSRFRCTFGNNDSQDLSTSFRIPKPSSTTYVLHKIEIDRYLWREVQKYRLRTTYQLILIFHNIFPLFAPVCLVLTHGSFNSARSARVMYTLLVRRCYYNSTFFFFKAKNKRKNKLNVLIIHYFGR